MMTSENGLTIDIDEVRSIIDESDVFSIGFRLFPERLFIDTRSDGTVGPMIRTVEPVDSLAARFHWLGRMRPHFDVPERFMFVPWPHTLRFFEEAGLLDRIRERLAGSAEMADRCEAVFRELRRRERNSLRQAIFGGGDYRTVWSNVTYER